MSEKETFESRATAFYSQDVIDTARALGDGQITPESIFKALQQITMADQEDVKAFLMQKVGTVDPEEAGVTIER